jgi:hypothetical protein
MSQQNLFIAVVLAALGLFAAFAPREMKEAYLPQFVSSQSDLVHQVLGAAVLVGAYYFYNDQKLY